MKNPWRSPYNHSPVTFGGCCPGLKVTRAAHAIPGEAAAELHAMLFTFSPSPGSISASGQTCFTLGARSPLEINKCTWICLFCCRFPAVSSQPAAQILVSKSQVCDLVLSTIKFHPLSTMPALRLLQPSSRTDIPSALPVPPTWCHQQMPSAPSYLLLQGLAEECCARSGELQSHLAEAARGPVSERSTWPCSLGTAPEPPPAPSALCPPCVPTARASLR